MTKDHTPIGVLRDIIAKRPDIGSERLLRVFEAYVYDDAELRRAIIQHAFASALIELSAQPSAGKSRCAPAVHLATVRQPKPL
jgi:hypothetical protein